MTLDTTQILILVVIAIVIIDAIKDLVWDIHVWRLMETLAGNQRAPTFPPVIVRPPDTPVQPPPVIPVVPPVDPPPVKPPVDPVKPPPITPPVPTVPAGPTHVWRGKCSVFGGPKDTGSGDPAEELAIIGAADIPNFQEVLLPGSHGAALFRQLNPDSFYFACRFDYTETSKSYLKTIHGIVKNPRTGQSEIARPVDWGPNAKTGRVADLSPGLAAKLGLNTDDAVEVSIPLPAGGPTQPTQPPVTGGTVLQHNSWPTPSQCPAFYGNDEATIRANVVNVQIPWLMNGKTHVIPIHKKAADSLERVVNFIWETCGKSQDQIHKFGYDVFDGSFVPRNIAGTGTRSYHWYGAAIDWDAARNPQHATAANTEFKEESLITTAFKREGWTWGGNWSPQYRDAMHFEAGDQ